MKRWVCAQQPCAGDVAAAVPAMAAKMRRARASAGMFLSLAGQRKSREPYMGIVRFSLRWPYTFYVLALLILFLGVKIGRAHV